MIIPAVKIFCTSVVWFPPVGFEPTTLRFKIEPSGRYRIVPVSTR